MSTLLQSLPLIAQGKVRDNYAVGDDKILMVASDRVSAFDVVMNEPLLGKGRLLTEMALFWFERLKSIVPNHLTGLDPESVVSPSDLGLVRGRSMLVTRLKPLPVEAVVRGYLAGSGWKDYCSTGSVSGVALAPGLRLAERLPEPIFTPATKAAVGDHDENISYESMAGLVGEKMAQTVREVSIELYSQASQHAAARGIIIADTKFEFGLDEQGTLTLMDEVLTPDSSRFWPADSYCVGLNPPSFDKQFLRDYLESLSSWNKRAPAPPVPQSVLDATLAKYSEALQRLTG